MNIGLNLSFAVKRWLDPAKLASICSEELHCKHVQFTWDLIDPWWPKGMREPIVREYRESFSREGVFIDASFGGLASYSYAHLLAPAKAQRDIAQLFFQNAIDLTLELGTKTIGTPVGGMDYSDARDQERRQERYKDLIERLLALAEYGKKAGLEEIQIETTPLMTEFPHSPAASVKLMEDLKASAIPCKLLIDWGHALFQPLLKEEADIFLWFKECGPFIGAIHLQQTDGILDRHWDFTREGIVTTAFIKSATESLGLSHIRQYVEVMTAFEEEDDAVLDRMKKTMEILHKDLEG